MKTLTASAARTKIYQLINDASDEPIQIMGKRGNAVIISEEDWHSIQETLYLLSIPGMRESIVKGINTPVSKTSRKLKW